LFLCADTLDVLLNSAVPANAVVWAWACFLNTDAAESVN